jgi:hypothetical protein
MAESPRRCASGGRKGTASTPTRPPTVTLSAENARTCFPPAPDPCPAASGALRAVDGRPLADFCRLLDVR